MAPACLKTGKEVCSASDMEQMSKITAEMDTEGEEKVGNAVKGSTIVTFATINNDNFF